jgi:hypothetical protein
MSIELRRSTRPRLETLEARLAMSLPPTANAFGLTPPLNTIGLSLGDATRPGSPAMTTVTIAPQNITRGKSSTEFGVFVQPYGSSGVVPQIVAVEQDGKRLPLQRARSYDPAYAGQPADQSVGFFETGKSGLVTILVSGQGSSSGEYTVETTLVGDVNGDGTVNLADEQAFAGTYAESAGEPDYSAAADYNQNGLINLYDALALERNMPPLSKPNSGWAVVNLAPQDEIHYSGPRNSGGITAKRIVTIDGVTTPGSLVLVDSKDGTYSFGSQALPTNAKGGFSIVAAATGNTAGLVTYNFKILDPFGHQYIRAFPVLWTAFATPGSVYHYKPSPPHKYGTGKVSAPHGSAGSP